MGQKHGSQKSLGILLHSFVSDEKIENQIHKEAEIGDSVLESEFDVESNVISYLSRVVYREHCYADVPPNQISRILVYRAFGRSLDILSYLMGYIYFIRIFFVSFLQPIFSKLGRIDRVHFPGQYVVYELGQGAEGSFLTTVGFRHYFL